MKDTGARNQFRTRSAVSVEGQEIAEQRSSKSAAAIVLAETTMPSVECECDRVVATVATTAIRTTTFVAEPTHRSCDRLAGAGASVIDKTYLARHAATLLKLAMSTSDRALARDVACWIETRRLCVARVSGDLRGSEHLFVSRYLRRNSQRLCGPTCFVSGSYETA
jgi:hypothetical protein